MLKEEVGYIGDKITDPKHITVALYQSLKKFNFEKLNKIIKLLIVDEAHWANNSINNILKEFTYTYYRFGVTATPVSKPKKSMYFNMCDQIGPVIFKVTETQAEKRVINDVDAYMFTFKCYPKQETYLKKYLFDVLLNKKRNELLCKMVQFALKKKKRKSILLLVDQYKQAEMIKQLSKKFKLPVPEIAWSKNKNLDDIKERLNNHTLPFCIATTVFGMGTDIPNLDTIILGSSRKSLTNLKQKIGRGRRRTNLTQNLLLLDIYDKIGDNDKYFERFSIMRKNFFTRKKWLKEIYE